MSSLSVAERIQKVDLLFALLKSRLGQNHHGGVEYYIDHGEPEIACELLAAGLLDSEAVLETEEKRELLNLCIECGVDTDEALNPPQWKRIETYLMS